MEGTQCTDTVQENSPPVSSFVYPPTVFLREGNVKLPPSLIPEHTFVGLTLSKMHFRGRELFQNIF